jgi:hypothetical protein
MKITNRQIRAARILLGWSRAQTLLKAGVSMFVLGELERDGPGAVSERALHRLIGCFEASGIRFVDDGVLLQRDRGHDTHRARQVGLTTAEQAAA